VPIALQTRGMKYFSKMLDQLVFEKDYQQTQLFPLGSENIEGVFRWSRLNNFTKGYPDCENTDFDSVNLVKFLVISCIQVFKKFHALKFLNIRDFQISAFSSYLVSKMSRFIVPLTTNINFLITMKI